MAKNMKKAWAENYKDSVEELSAKDVILGGQGQILPYWLNYHDLIDGIIII